MRIIRQYDASDCAAACLAMIASAYGKGVSISLARQAIGTDRDGATLHGIVTGARSLGFRAEALHGDRLSSQLPTPCIAHVTREDTTHFLVIKRVTRRWVVLFDPAMGRRKVSKDGFSTEWTGYTVVVAPGATFEPNRTSTDGIMRFIPLLTPHLNTILWTILTSIVLTGLAVASAAYTRLLIDEILPARSRFTLHALTATMVVFASLQVILTTIRSHMLLVFSVKLDLSLVLRVWSKVLRLPTSFFDSRRTGEVLSRLDDTQHVEDALSDAGFSIIFDALMTLVVGTALILISPRLFLIALVVLPLSSIVIWLFARPLRRMYEDILHLTDERESVAVETIQGISAVHAVNGQDAAIGRIEDRIYRIARADLRASRLGITRGAIVSTIDNWGSYALFWTGSILILDRTISLGTLLSFNVLLGYFWGPLQNLLALQPQLAEASVAARRLGEILDYPDGNDPVAARASSHSLMVVDSLRDQPIVIENVTFRYGSRRPVLNEVTFTVFPGVHSVLAGPNGCGKSTVAKLLLGFYRPEIGCIRFGEYDLADLDVSSVRRRIGYVSQRSFVLTGSIFHNISMGKQNISIADVARAAERSGAKELIEALPDRYNCTIGEGGRVLSGGEEQRILLARALVEDPDILILDEAATHLDRETRAGLLRRVDSLRHDGLTVLSITHDEQVIASADRVIAWKNHDQKSERLSAGS